MLLLQTLHSATAGNLRKRWGKISALRTMGLLPNQPQISLSYFMVSIFETRRHDGDYFASRCAFQRGSRRTYSHKIAQRRQYRRSNRIACKSFLFNRYSCMYLGTQRNVRSPTTYSLSTPATKKFVLKGKKEQTTD